MDLLEAIGDLGVTDPASDPQGAERARAGLLRELEPPHRHRASRPRWRRSPRWLIGIPALAAVAAAALAVVLIASQSSPRRIYPRARIGGRPPAMHTAAYVVRHVRAELVALDRSGGVVTSSIDSAGSPVYHDVVYIDPRTAALYQADTAETRAGRVLFVNVDESVPIHDHEHVRTFSIDYTQQTWSSGTGTDGVPIPKQSGPAFRHPWPGARSTPAAVQRALSSHLETRVGTTTLDGVRVLILTGRSGIVHITLYVNARTYQPLREVDRGKGADADVDQVTDVLPATAANIARAEDRPRIPPGYTFVAP